MHSNSDTFVQRHVPLNRWRHCIDLLPLEIQLIIDPSSRTGVAADNYVNTSNRSPSRTLNLSSTSDIVHEERGWTPCDISLCDFSARVTCNVWDGCRSKYLNVQNRSAAVVIVYSSSNWGGYLRLISRVAQSRLAKSIN